MVMEISPDSVEVQQRGVETWSELTLNVVLQDKSLFEKLLEYTTKEHNSENVQFLVDTFAFQLLCAIEPVDEDCLKVMGGNIFRQYVAEDCPSQVNLPSEVAENIAAVVKQDEPLPHDIFDRAKNEIYSLVNLDVFPRFLHWLVSTEGKLRVEQTSHTPKPVDQTIATSNPKLTSHFGESAVRGPKAYQILGDDISIDQLQHMARARDNELRVKRRASITEREKVLSQRRPSNNQVALKLARQLSFKALRVAGAFNGEKALLKQSQYVVPTLSQSKKVSEVLGESIVRGSKAHAILGDNMTASQVKNMVRACHIEKASLRRKSTLERDRVLDIKHPTHKQTNVSLQKRLSQKALMTAGAFAGDHDGELLLKKSQSVVDKPTANPKVIKLIGESAVAGRKAFQMLGDSMTTEQIASMKKEEAASLKRSASKYAVGK